MSVYVRFMNVWLFVCESMAIHESVAVWVDDKYMEFVSVWFFVCCVTQVTV